MFVVEISTNACKGGSFQIPVAELTGVRSCRCQALRRWDRYPFVSLLLASSLLIGTDSSGLDCKTPSFRCMSSDWNVVFTCKTLILCHRSLSYMHWHHTVSRLKFQTWLQHIKIITHEVGHTCLMMWMLSLELRCIHDLPTWMPMFCTQYTL